MEKKYERREASIADTILDFCDANRKVVAACAVGLVMILLLAFGSGASKTQTKLNKDIQALVESYYSYRASGDTARLEEIAYPITDAEKNYIQYMSDEIDRYTNTSVLIKEADTEGSWLVGAYSNVDFAGQRTSVPGLESFVVRTKEDGSLYIDNVYSNFNRLNLQNATDPTVISLLAAFEGEDDYKALKAKLEEDTAKAYESDENLQTYVTETLQAKVDGWASYYQSQLAAAEEANAVTLYLQSTVAVKASASAESEDLGTLAVGTAVKKYSEENGFARIAFGDGRGYVPADQLGEAAPEGTTVAVGTVFRLTGSLNIRAERSADSEKVATAYAGDELEALEESIDGWTKVKYKIYEGYVRTDLLLAD